MQIDIERSDDLAALYGTYIELVERGRAETLELRVAPGVYGVASFGPIQLDLGGNPPPRDPQIDVVIRGEPSTPPVVFHDLGLLVHARSLTLENLILTGRHQGVLEARVARHFAMKRCVVAANSWDPSWGGAVLRVTGMHDQPAYTVELEDCWFARNGEQSPAALLALVPATGGYIERVELRGLRFLGNTTSVDLAIHEAREVRGRDLFVIKDARGGQVFLRYDRCEKVALEHSTFVLGGAGALASEDTRSWFSGVDLAGSKVYLGGVVRKLPAGVRGGPEVLDGDAAVARARQLDGVIAALMQGVPAEGAAHAHLRDAVGL
jgi:hypothetical protein